MTFRPNTLPIFKTIKFVFSASSKIYKLRSKHSNYTIFILKQRQSNSQNRNHKNCITPNDRKLNNRRHDANNGKQINEKVYKQKTKERRRIRTRITKLFIEIYNIAHFIIFNINDGDFSLIRIASAIWSCL